MPISLAPYLALATVIERFWETLFNLLESLVLSFGGTVSVFGDEITELMKQKAEVVSGAANLSDPETQATVSSINDALEAALKSPRYVAIKRFITLFGSLILGLVCSSTANLGIFHQAGFSIWHPMDVLLTGVLIGAGAEPVHQVITGLQSARDALTGLAQLAKGAALRNAVQAINQSDQQTQAVGAPADDNAPLASNAARQNTAVATAQIVRAQRLIQR